MGSAFLFIYFRKYSGNNNKIKVYLCIDGRYIYILL